MIAAAARAALSLPAPAARKKPRSCSPPRSVRQACRSLNRATPGGGDPPASIAPTRKTRLECIRSRDRVVGERRRTSPPGLLRVGHIFWADQLVEFFPGEVPQF